MEEDFTEIIKIILYFYMLILELYPVKDSE